MHIRQIGISKSFAQREIPARFPMAALDNISPESYHIVSNQIKEADASTRFQNDVGGIGFSYSQKNFRKTL